MLTDYMVLHVIFNARYGGVVYSIELCLLYNSYNIEPTFFPSVSLGEDLLQSRRKKALNFRLSYLKRKL
jgi:hypothetical protein